MPEFSHTLQVSAPPAEVFAILDDTSRTPQWLDRCTRLDSLGSGANEVGTALRYHYQDGRRRGEMTGEVVAREPTRHFAVHFVDAASELTLDFVTATGANDAMTSLTHTVVIRPKGLARLGSSRISRALPEQTLEALARLKALAEHS